MTSHQTSANGAIAMLGLAQPVAASVVSEWDDRMARIPVDVFKGGPDRSDRPHHVCSGCRQAILGAGRG